MLEAVNNPWELLGGGYDKMYEQKNVASHWKQTKRLVSDVLLITGKVTDTPTNPAFCTTLYHRNSLLCLVTTHHHTDGISSIVGMGQGT